MPNNAADIIFLIGAGVLINEYRINKPRAHRINRHQSMQFAIVATFLKVDLNKCKSRIVFSKYVRNTDR